MKNFSELLAIEQLIEIETTVDGIVNCGSVPLLQPIRLEIPGNLTSICIDNFDVSPYTWCQDGVWHFEIDQPFYQWRHVITGQGWLLEPQ
jgi:hypothetical protein